MSGHGCRVRQRVSLQGKMYVFRLTWTPWGRMTLTWRAVLLLGSATKGARDRDRLVQCMLVLTVTMSLSQQNRVSLACHLGTNEKRVVVRVNFLIAPVTLSTDNLRLVIGGTSW